LSCPCTRLAGFVSGRPRHACHAHAHVSLVLVSGRRWQNCHARAHASLVLVSGRPRHACHAPAHASLALSAVGRGTLATPVHTSHRFLSAVGRGTLATPMHTPYRFLSGRRWHNCHASLVRSPWRTGLSRDQTRHDKNNLKKLYVHVPFILENYIHTRT
jgi:hypothetical protein